MPVSATAAAIAVPIIKKYGPVAIPAIIDLMKKILPGGEGAKKMERAVAVLQGFARADGEEIDANSAKEAIQAVYDGVKRGQEEGKAVWIVVGDITPIQVFEQK